MNVSLRDVDVSKDGKIIVAGRDESRRTALEDEQREESDEETKPRQLKEESDEVYRLLAAFLQIDL